MKSLLIGGMLMCCAHVASANGRVIVEKVEGRELNLEETMEFYEFFLDVPEKAFPMDADLREEAWKEGEIVAFGKVLKDYEWSRNGESLRARIEKYTPAGDPVWSVTCVYKSDGLTPRMLKHKYEVYKGKDGEWQLKRVT